MAAVPRQVQAEVVDAGRVGAYHLLALRAPAVATQVQPGHFVALGIDGRDSSMLLRRSFSVYRTRTDTVDVVFAVQGRGTAWLAGQRPGDEVDVVGPLGRPFQLPAEPGPSVLVGGGYGSAPLLSLAAALRSRGGAAHLVLGAATADRLFGVGEARAAGLALDVTTDDGSAGTPGRVTAVLPEVLGRTGASSVYACGPMPMLRAVSEVASAYGLRAQCAVEEAMACGIGVCMTCVLPVIGDDGVTRMVRSCVEGPVFAGDRVRWADVGTVPADAWGAPVASGARP